MKIFSAEQVKKWDAYTITHEPVASIDLMERASVACSKWLLGKNFGSNRFRIFSGKGNNGGDGLAIARMLIEHNCRVSVYILAPIAIGVGKAGTEDFQTNLERLHQFSTDIHFIQSAEFFPAINDTDIVIDSLFGTGLNKPVDGINKELVENINRSNATIISIDLPSGLFADKPSKGNSVINATHTISFMHHKLVFLLAENEEHCGEVHLLNIGLHKDFENEEPAVFEFADAAFINPIYKPRKKFTHKGTYGHAALVCGSYGMMGAAVLTSSACMRSGVGKLTSFVPGCGYDIIQTAVPEAMCMVSGDKYLLPLDNIENFDTVGIGPGIGIHASHKELISGIFKQNKKPMVIDADALNFLAQHKDLLKGIPSLSILTPHPKEFERLFGSTADDHERSQLALQRSKELNVVIILKGHYSFISTPDGKGYFNSTGNAGMATAGSGDVLTGILTGLLAQGYSSIEAALLGTYLHGLAGDIAAEKRSKESMIAGDIVECIGEAFRSFI